MDPPLAGSGSAFLVKVWAFPLPRWESKTECVGRGSSVGEIWSMFPLESWVVACHFIPFFPPGSMFGFSGPFRVHVGFLGLVDLLPSGPVLADVGCLAWELWLRGPAV